MKTALVGLLDCNNFFVSCERLFRPDLIGKPVVVLSSNDGCVVARSQEAKQLGIPMGIPHFKIRDVLRTHQVAVFSSNITLYRDISSRIMHALTQLVEHTEVYSVDEAFFSITDKDPHDAVRTIRDTIEQWTGIPVSIGVGQSKTIAKYASERAKEDARLGIGDSTHCFLDTLTWRETARDIPVELLWGVGRKTTEQFVRMGIRTARDIIDLPRSTLRSAVGMLGERLHDELTGSGALMHTGEAAIQASMMSTRSFGAATSERSVIDDAIAYHIATTAEKMRMQECMAGSVRVFLYPSRYGEYAGAGGSAVQVLTTATCDTRLLIREALILLDTLYTPDVLYTKAGISLGAFTPFVYTTASLLDGDSLETSRVLMQTIDAMNARFGSGSVRPATVQKTHRWQSIAKSRSPQYTTAWGALRQVQSG